MEKDDSGALPLGVPEEIGGEVVAGALGPSRVWVRDGGTPGDTVKAEVVALLLEVLVRKFEISKDGNEVKS